MVPSLTSHPELLLLSPPPPLLLVLHLHIGNSVSVAPPVALSHPRLRRHPRHPTAHRRARLPPIECPLYPREGHRCRPHDNSQTLTRHHAATARRGGGAPSTVLHRSRSPPPPLFAFDDLLCRLPLLLPHRACNPSPCLF
jgi:hypothetical protein